jgi:hypothetical protein
MSLAVEIFEFLDKPGAEEFWAHRLVAFDNEQEKDH